MSHRFAVLLPLFLAALVPAVLPSPAARAAPAPSISDEARLAPVVRQTLQRAIAGDVVAQHNLANIYEYGKGVARDYAEALKWYEAAAEQGLPYSQHALSDMLRQGLGTAVNAPLAAAWCARAADQGLAVSQHNLALMYEFGFGVARDRVRALMWFALAAELHDEADRRAAAAEGGARVAAGLTPEQIAEADRLADEWMAKPRQSWPSLGTDKAGG